ncbi:tetratricopeptide repeat protein [Salinisphaera orenii]|uniref:tetratricopeptide repeat protein n=1 Tax=Salinisphaera orenii TaxID=856731 RepID=UPI000DBE56CD
MSLRQIGLRFLEVLGSLTLLGLLGMASLWLYAAASTEMTELEKLQNAAANGDAEAQCELGLTYNEGHLVNVTRTGLDHDEDEPIKENPEQAATWLRKSAEQGYARAQHALGTLYSSGRGVPENDDKALKWERKAADQGNPAALYSLGRNYEHGSNGVSKDKSKAFELYYKAEKEGYFKHHKLFRQQYYSKSASYYYKRAQHGDTSAQYRLGERFKSGDGVPRDREKALKWLRKAARQGNAHAQYSLGQIIRPGGVHFYSDSTEFNLGSDPGEFNFHSDKTVAAIWLILAKTNETTTDAAFALNELKPKMSPAKIETAKDAAQEWRKKHRH